MQGLDNGAPGLPRFGGEAGNIYYFAGDYIMGSIRGSIKSALQEPNSRKLVNNKTRAEQIAGRGDDEDVITYTYMRWKNIPDSVMF